MRHYVTAVRPSSHLAPLEDAAGELTEVQLTSGVMARLASQPADRRKGPELVVVFSARLHAGQLRGLHHTVAKNWREFEELWAARRARIPVLMA
jgi:hypothetical protein